MDKIRQEVGEKNEADAEKQYQALIRQMRDSRPGKIEEHIQRESELHLMTLKKIDEGKQTLTNKVDEMKAAEALEHEKRKEELHEKLGLRLAAASNKCDIVTQATLDNLEGAIEKLKQEIQQLEIENSNCYEKKVELEVQLKQRNFAEVDEKKDKYEEEAQKTAEAVYQLTADQLKEEQMMLAEERTEKKKNAAALIAAVENDLVEQRKVGNATLLIKKSTEESKNRRQINSKISTVRDFKRDMEESYRKVIGVLDAPPDQYEKLTRKRKRAADNELTRFSEILVSTDRKLSEIEENLAILELAGVEMGAITRAIKTQISSFSRIISGLQMILSLEGVPMDETKSMDFTAAKEELFKQINQMELINEKRGELRQCIENLHDETTPVVELAIEN
uniref:Coiled-coil domain-containing protein 22 homolog n=1 Tax=Caenorhabditis tropicalis TaxID=1561998 RepID=A0A1I7SZ07_9PELO